MIKMSILSSISIRVATLIKSDQFSIRVATLIEFRRFPIRVATLIKSQRFLIRVPTLIEKRPKCVPGGPEAASNARAKREFLPVCDQGRDPDRFRCA